MTFRLEEVDVELGFRWYGANDQVNLNHIRQIPNMKQVVSGI